MPTIQVQTPPTTEPITLALASAALRLDLDLVSTDPARIAEREFLNLLLSAAREKVEAFTGRYYAPCTLAVTYELGEPYVLPAGATAVSVSGFFATLADLEAFNVEEYRKGISINRELAWPYPALNESYTVVVNAIADTQYQSLAKTAMLELAGEWYRNRETTQDGRFGELPVSYRVKLTQAVVQPLGS